MATAAAFVIFVLVVLAGIPAGAWSLAGALGLVFLVGVFIITSKEFRKNVH